MITFFSRPHSEDFYVSYVPKITNQVNENNIHKISKRKIKSFFNIEDSKNFLAYRFMLLTNWMKKYERYKSSYITQLNNVINKLYLAGQFNSHELQYIKNVEAIASAYSRNMKQLIVDFPVDGEETVYYKYPKGSIYINSGDTLKPLCTNGECYLSDKRIIIAKDLDIYPISFKHLTTYQFSKLGLTFYLKNDTSYFISCEQNFVLYASLIRLFRYIKFNI